MTKGAALLLGLGISLAALLYGGIWEYGDGFLFNRFTGNVIYVRLPDSDPLDHTNHLTTGREAFPVRIVTPGARRSGAPAGKLHAPGTSPSSRI